MFVAQKWPHNIKFTSSDIRCIPTLPLYQYFANKLMEKPNNMDHKTNLQHDVVTTNQQCNAKPMLSVTEASLGTYLSDLPILISHSREPISASG